jgi:hypothetical protein
MVRAPYVTPTEKLPRVTQSFVARIWVEHALEQDPQWRGHIQHIQGGEEVYFRDLAEMCAFLEQTSGIAVRGFAGPPRQDMAAAKPGAVAAGRRKSDK